MGHNSLAGRWSDEINAVLAAGYNFRRLLALLQVLFLAFPAAIAPPTSRDQRVAA